MTKTTTSPPAMTMAARIARLRDMTAVELKDEWRRITGEEPRSSNKQFLFKRLAWRIQAIEEGDLSERARARAVELARDADVRIYQPREKAGATATPANGRVRNHRLPHKSDRRLPQPGTVLTREYQGRHIEVRVLETGFEFEGTTYRSLTAVAQAVTGSHWNGFGFFREALGANGAAK